MQSIWTKISEGSFQHLVESMTQKIVKLCRQKEGPALCWQDLPNKVTSVCALKLQNVYVCMYVCGLVNQL